MKTRNGFVSNSSSSSFIVAFPYIPETVEEVKQMLFGDIERIDIYDYSITTSQMAGVVFKDMLDSGIVNKEKIMEEVSLGQFPGCPEHDYNYRDEEAMNKYFEIWDKAAVKLGNDFINANLNGHFFIFEYCDNDGPLYSTMEHGDIFSRLPNIQIGKH